MTLAKICGITNFPDAATAVKYGADELGFNFYTKSSRYIEAKAAAAIAGNLPGRVRKIGVFVNEDIERVLETVRIAKLDGVQLHGDEPTAYADMIKGRSNVSVIKAFRVSDDFDAAVVLGYDVDAVLLDTYSKNGYGGTGEVFNWAIAKMVKASVPKLYLAGGLSELNVAEAIAEVEPYCVDACSCLESKPGTKDESKLRDFLKNAGRTQHEF